MRSFIKFSIIAIFFITLFLTPLITYNQVRCLQDAWRLYNRSEMAYSNGKTRMAADSFIAAIQSCNLCITQFRDTALAIQRSYGNHCPPVGTVSEAIRRDIYSKWQLNDIATACFIKAKAAEYLLKIDRSRYAARSGDLENARILVRQASKGRCWDPSGWFWSPCQALLGGDKACCQ